MNANSTSESNRPNRGSKLDGVSQSSESWTEANVSASAAENGIVGVTILNIAVFLGQSMFGDISRLHMGASFT